MPFQFTSPAAYRYKESSVFLGRDQTGADIGIETERHLIAVGGAGSGKGAAVLIPNLLRWPHSALCIDPKGENAEVSAHVRAEMGQTVGVIDPFRSADVPESLRVSINPLSGIDPASPTARGDVETIADGLVKRSDPKHAEWDDGAASVIAGVIAYVLHDPPPEGAALPLLRRVLLQGKDDLYADAQRMLDCDACGGLARAAGSTIMAALEGQKGIEKDFLAGAKRHTAWLDDPAIAAVLSSSTFDMRALTTGTGTLYLVLPPHYIESKAAFLRLFVRSAIHIMASAGNRRGGRCLFLLDEFYALGKLDIVAKAAGLMRSYGVHLFPFLQDLGQLQELYGKAGSETFFGNADAHLFFGNADTLTLQYVSDRLGRLTPNEITTYTPSAPTSLPAPQQGAWSNDNSAMARYQNDMADYNHRMRMVGQPRFTPAEVAALVGKGNGDTVARSMIVFAKSGDILNLKLSTWWKGLPPSREELATAATAEGERLKAEKADFESWQEWFVSNSFGSIWWDVLKRQMRGQVTRLWYMHIAAVLLWLYWIAELLNASANSYFTLAETSMGMKALAGVILTPPIYFLAWLAIEGIGTRRELLNRMNYYGVLAMTADQVAAVRQRLMHRQHQQAQRQQTPVRADAVYGEFDAAKFERGRLVNERAMAHVRAGGGIMPRGHQENDDETHYIVYRNEKNS